MKHRALSLLLALAGISVFPSCATIGPPLPPSLDLPRPPQDLRASRKANRITLTWTVPTTTTDRETIRILGTTRICRSTAGALNECGKPVGEVAPPPQPSSTNKSSGKKITASFTDALPPELESTSEAPSATYAVEVLNREVRSAGLSNQVQISLLLTLPPPQNFQARLTSQGVVLSWTNAPVPEFQQGQIHFVTRLYRREEGSPRQTAVGETPVQSEAILTDPNIEWEKTYEYHAENVTVVNETDKSKTEVEGDDTPQVKVVTHDIFPPAVPLGLQAVFSGPGQSRFIDLVWAPVTDADLAGYNVYRREEGAAPQKINADPLKSPAFRDKQVSAGKRYFYSVTSIDSRGNESAHSEEASEAVPES
jgi:hypothetical protein